MARCLPVILRLGRFEARKHAQGIPERQGGQVGADDCNAQIGKQCGIRVADVDRTLDRLELLLEVVERLEPIGRFEQIRHKRERMLEHRGAIDIRAVVALRVGEVLESRKRCRRQAHELHLVARIGHTLVMHALGHACDEELHDAVVASGTVAHEVQRPADHAPVVECGQPAGDRLHYAVGIYGIEHLNARVLELLHAAERELHLRQRLAFAPLLGNLLDLHLHLMGRLIVGAHLIDNALTLRFVDGRANVLPLLAGGLPALRVNEHLVSHHNGVPSELLQVILGLLVDGVEHRGP